MKNLQLTRLLSELEEAKMIVQGVRETYTPGIVVGDTAISTSKFVVDIYDNHIKMVKHLIRGGLI